MSKNDKKNKQKTDEINFVAIIIRVIAIILIVAVLGGLFWVYMNAFKPEEKRLIKNSRFAYNEISRIVYDIYRKKGKVYDCDLWREGDKLIVRGKIAFLGRNQTWEPNTTFKPATNEKPVPHKPRLK